jgi:hypothetical protein
MERKQFNDPNGLVSTLLFQKLRDDPDECFCFEVKEDDDNMEEQQ